MSTRSFRVEVRRHKDTGLFLAESPEHKGLCVTARSEKQLEEMLPGALKQLLQAEGIEVRDVILDRGETDEAFLPPGYIANAELRGDAA